MSHRDIIEYGMSNDGQLPLPNYVTSKIKI